MAYRETKHYTKDLPFIWNVSHSVGPTRTNRKADVALVQAMLRKAYQNSFITELAIDGDCGPKTKAAIKKFQQDYSVYSVGAGLEPLEQAGIVTWADNFGFEGGGKTYTAFTIVALNFTLAKNARTIWQNLCYDPGVPVYVRMELLKTAR